MARKRSTRRRARASGRHRASRRSYGGGGGIGRGGIVAALTAKPTMAAVAGGAAMIATTAIAVPKIIEKITKPGERPSNGVVTAVNIATSIAGFVAARAMKAPNVALGALVGGVGGTLGVMAINAYNKSQQGSGVRGLGNAGQRFVIDGQGNLYPVRGLGQGERDAVIVTQEGSMGRQLTR